MTRHLCFPKITTNFDSSDHRTVSCFASVHFKANELRSRNGSIAGSCSHTASLQWCSQEVIFHAVIYITESLLFITQCCQAASRLIFDIIPMAQRFLQILWILLMIFECRWLYIHSWQFFVVERYFEIVPHFKDAAFFFFTDLPIFTSEKLSLRCSRANRVTDLLPINLISCSCFFYLLPSSFGVFFLTCCWHQNELIFIMK